MKDISQILPDAQAFDAKLIGGLRRAVGHTVITTVAKARSQHRWRDRTGFTRESIDGNVRDLKKGARGHVWAGANAVRLNAGTSPHRIEAKNGKALRFMVGGSAVFRRAVNHPGTAPDPFLTAAEMYAEDEIYTAAMAALDDALGV